MTKRETKGINKLFSPFEIFYDKHKEEFVADNVFASRNAARGKYRDLSEKKSSNILKKPRLITILMR